MKLSNFSDSKTVDNKNLFLPCVRHHFGDESIVFVEAKGAVLKDSKEGRLEIYRRLTDISRKSKKS